MSRARHKMRADGGRLASEEGSDKPKWNAGEDQNAAKEAEEKKRQTARRTPLSASEIERANQWLKTHGIEDACFAADAKMSVGIRIVCDLNVLDASLEGLLADRTQIEGHLLHYFAVEEAR